MNEIQKEGSRFPQLQSGEWEIKLKPIISAAGCNLGDFREVFCGRNRTCTVEDMGKAIKNAIDPNNDRFCQLEQRFDRSEASVNRLTETLERFMNAQTAAYPPHTPSGTPSLRSRRSSRKGGNPPPQSERSGKMLKLS